MKTAVFWVATPCIPINIHWRFRRTCFLNHPVRTMEISVKLYQITMPSHPPQDNNLCSFRTHSCIFSHNCFISNRDLLKEVKFIKRGMVEKIVKNIGFEKRSKTMNPQWDSQCSGRILSRIATNRTKVVNLTAWTNLSRAVRGKQSATEISLIFESFKMEPICCPETSVRNYHYTLL